MIHLIHVTDYLKNENGLSISYRVNGRYYHLILSPEQAAEEMENIGSTADTLSQHDSILICAAHEQRKAIKTAVNLDLDPVFQLLNGITKDYAFVNRIKL